MLNYNDHDGDHDDDVAVRIVSSGYESEGTTPSI